MDPLSVSASIVSVISAAEAGLRYLNGLKNAPAEREQVLSEVSSIYGLLVSLRFRVETASSNDFWFVAVRNLAAPGGALDAMRMALDSLAQKLVNCSG